MVSHLILNTYVVDEANRYAMALQSSICENFASNGCMAQVPGYDRLCAKGGSGDSGARSMLASISAAFIVITGLLVNALF